jgi:hypothetical protein
MVFRAVFQVETTGGSVPIPYDAHVCIDFGQHLQKMTKCIGVSLCQLYNFADPVSVVLL